MQKGRLSPEVAKGSVRLLRSNWQRRGADIVINYHSHPEAAEETAIVNSRQIRDFPGRCDLLGEPGF
jgi:hypothetical protein